LGSPGLLILYPDRCFKLAGLGVLDTECIQRERCGPIKHPSCFWLQLLLRHLRHFVHCLRLGFRRVGAQATQIGQRIVQIVRHLQLGLHWQTSYPYSCWPASAASVRVSWLLTPKSSCRAAGSSSAVAPSSKPAAPAVADTRESGQLALTSSR